MPGIPDIYRPIHTPDWLDDIRRHVAANFAGSVQLYNHAPSVRLLGNPDPRRVSRYNREVSNEDIVRQLAKVASFAQSLDDIEVTGVGYYRKDKAKAVDLVIKMAPDERLREENDRAIAALAVNGLTLWKPMNRFNAVIGRAHLQYLSGDEKVALQHNLTDLVSSDLSLQPAKLRRSP